MYVSREYGADSLLVSCWVSPPITDDRCPPAAERGLDQWLDVLQPAPIPSGLHPPAPLSGRPACRILRALQELTAPPRCCLRIFRALPEPEHAEPLLAKVVMAYSCNPYG